MSLFLNDVIHRIKVIYVNNTDGVLYEMVGSSLNRFRSHGLSKNLFKSKTNDDLARNLNVLIDDLSNVFGKEVYVVFDEDVSFKRFYSKELYLSARLAENDMRLANFCLVYHRGEFHCQMY